MMPLIGTLAGWIGGGLMIWGWGAGSRAGKIAAVTWITLWLGVCIVGLVISSAREAALGSVNQRAESEAGPKSLE